MQKPTTPPNLVLPDGTQPTRPTHAPDGTDLTLIRATLALSIEERLMALQSQAQFIVQIRRENGLS